MRGCHNSRCFGYIILNMHEIYEYPIKIVRINDSDAMEIRFVIHQTNRKCEISGKYM